MLRTFHKRGILVAALAALTAGSVLAQTQPATPGATPAPTPGVSGSPIQMPSVIPSKSETAPSAFEKLAMSRSFVTKEDAGKLDGFARAFSDADRDKDGKLNPDEFAVAWAIYTGKT